MLAIILYLPVEIRPDNIANISSLRILLAISAAIALYGGLLWAFVAQLQLFHRAAVGEPFRCRDLYIGTVGSMIATFLNYWFLMIAIVLPSISLYQLVPSEYSYGTAFLFSWQDAFLSGNIVIFAEWIVKTVMQSGILATAAGLLFHCLGSLLGGTPQLSNPVLCNRDAA